MLSELRLNPRPMVARLEGRSWAEKRRGAGVVVAPKLSTGFTGRPDPGSTADSRPAIAATKEKAG
jgi:hypothetical protein